MLTQNEIMQIIEKGENGSVEFKTSDVRPDSLAREIVGFSNSQGGVVLLGVDDSGSIIGLDSSTKYAEWVTNISRNNVVPPIDCVYYEAKLSDTSIGLIEVPKGFDKPYQTTDGKFLIRVNSTLRTASQGELLRLFQQAGVYHFDQTGVTGSSIADLNMFQLDKYFEKYGLKLSEESVEGLVNTLKNADILTQFGEMTVAGALIFGINPPKFLKQSGISFASFADNELSSELLDKKEIEGTLDIVIDSCTSLIHNFIPSPSDIIDNIRTNLHKTWSRKVYRELIANACIHRNYSITGSKIRVLMFPNRLEIISPGRLPNTVTIEKLKVGVSYAVNPVISKFMENMGYIDKLGRGIPMVYNESKILGKKLDMKEIGEEFKVTLEL